jgi:amino acid transporter
VLAYGLLAFAMVVLVIAFGYGSVENLEPFVASPDPTNRFSGVFTVFSMALLFYGGFNFASQSFGERKASVTPRKIAAAMFLSLLAALVFYSTIILSAALLLPRDDLLALELPAATMFEAALGSRGLRDFVLVFGLIGLITSWNGAVFAGSRLLVFLSDIHLLPAFFGRLHAKHGTPVNAVAAISWVTPLIALLGQGGIIALAKALSFAIAVAWLTTVVSVLRLRRTRAGQHRPFRVRPAWLVFALAIAGTSFAVLETGRGFVLPGPLRPSVEGAITLGWAALGYLFWLANSRRRKSISDHQRVQFILNQE